MAGKSEQRPSRSGRKRAAQTVQRLADRLIDLPEQQCRALVADEDLRAALAEARRLIGTSAGRRQRLLVGKMLRDRDTASLEAALRRDQRMRREDTQLFREAERWRDRLLSEGDDALVRLAADVPDADLTRIRSLVDKQALIGDRARRKHDYRELFRELHRLLSERTRG